MSDPLNPTNPEHGSADWGDDNWGGLDTQNFQVNQLTDEEKSNRVRFVEEYMYDHDPVKAAIRCGFMKSLAVKIADRYLGEPFVLRLIRDAEEEFDFGDKKIQHRIKRRVMNRLVAEVDSFGMDSDSKTRISASATVAKLMEMEPSKKLDLTHTGGSPVMVVPGIASIDDWEKHAGDSQNKLLDDTQTEDEDE